MLQQDGGGAIVNMASIAGLVGGTTSAYVASKHGVVGVTKQAALEYAPRGIRVNAVCPGVIQTPLVDRVFAARPGLAEQWLAMEPIGRLGTAEEVASAVVWLCSDAASFVTGSRCPLMGDGSLSKVVERLPVGRSAPATLSAQSRASRERSTACVHRR